MTSARKKRMIGLAVGVSALFLIFAISAVAGRGFGRWHPDRELARKMIASYVEDALDEMNADPSQRAEAMALADEIMSELAAMRASHGEDKASVLAELKKDRPDAAALHAMLDSRFNKLEDFAHGKLDKALKFFGTLRPDQRAILIEKMQEHFDRHQEHFDRHDAHEHRGVH